MCLYRYLHMHTCHTQTHICVYTCIIFLFLCILWTCLKFGNSRKILQSQKIQGSCVDNAYPNSEPWLAICVRARAFVLPNSHFLAIFHFQSHHRSHQHRRPATPPPRVLQVWAQVVIILQSQTLSSCPEYRCLHHIPWQQPFWQYREFAFTTVFSFNGIILHLQFTEKFERFGINFSFSFKLFDGSNVYRIFFCFHCPWLSLPPFAAFVHRSPTLPHPPAFPTLPAFWLGLQWYCNSHRRGRQAGFDRERACWVGEGHVASLPLPFGLEVPLPARMSNPGGRGSKGPPFQRPLPSGCWPGVQGKILNFLGFLMFLLNSV